MDPLGPAASAAKPKHYWKAVGPFKDLLHKTITPEQLVARSEKKPAIHLAYAARQFAIVLGCGVILFTDQPWWIAGPLIVMQGFTFFNMTNAELGMKPHTYREVLSQWFVLNRAPHTNWDLANNATPDARPSLSEPETAPGETR